MSEIKISTGAVKVTLPLYQRNGKAWSSGNRYATMEAEFTPYCRPETTMVKLHLRDEGGITASATFTLEHLEATVEAMRRVIR